tara:strand:+ start:2830 stop:3291 length:462 start_codon:yes stop_codon:yes gene_type:complete
MKILFIILFLFTLNCSTNKVSKNHGFRLIENKFEMVELNKSNKNDVKTIIGPPSSISNFNNNKWFYIERKKTNQSIVKLGTKKINRNNVLILEFNNLGILIDKKILNLDDMNKIKIAKNTTKKKYKNNNLIYGVFNSLREKINSTSRTRKRKN